MFFGRPLRVGRPPPGAALEHENAQATLGEPRRDDASSEARPYNDDVVRHDVGDRRKLRARPRRTRDSAVRPWYTRGMARPEFADKALLLVGTGASSGAPFSRRFTG